MSLRTGLVRPYRVRAVRAVRLVVDSMSGVITSPFIQLPDCHVPFTDLNGRFCKLPLGQIRRLEASDLLLGIL